ncbi:MAG: hypothetical protein ABI988_00470 [Nitrospirota bacterium]
MPVNKIASEGLIACPVDQDKQFRSVARQVQHVERAIAKVGHVAIGNETAYLQWLCFRIDRFQRTNRVQPLLDLGSDFWPVYQCHPVFKNRGVIDVVIVEMRQDQR